MDDPEVAWCHANRLMDDTNLGRNGFNWSLLYLNLRIGGLNEEHFISHPYRQHSKKLVTGF